MAHVDTSALAAFGDGNSTGPSQRFDNIDSEGDVFTLPSICISILLRIADNFAYPAWLLTREECMLSDVTEPLHSGIFALELLHRRAQLFLRQIKWLVSDAACLQNDLMHIAPCLDVA